MKKEEYMKYNLEEFLDHHMRKDTMNVEIYYKDGTYHDDANYHYYQVIDVKYEGRTCIIHVNKYKKFAHIPVLDIQYDGEENFDDDEYDDDDDDDDWFDEEDDE